jgi:hypothetical protein
VMTGLKVVGKPMCTRARGWRSAIARAARK